MTVVAVAVAHAETTSNCTSLHTYEEGLAARPALFIVPIFNGTMTRDGYHLHKPYGRYTAACTWYEKIFRTNVIGNAYQPKGMTPEQCLAAQKSAHAAVKKPNRVTIIK